jgi:signal transduction histidine kinase
MTLVSTLVTVIVVTLLWVYLLRRRLERQQAARLSFSRQVLERLEDERRRIAVNLHDSLGQTLMVIKNHALLAMLRPAGEPELKQRLDEISGATSQAIEEVRQITHGLRPYQLDRLGLTQAIRASISRATADSSISFAIRVEEIDGLFDADAEIHLYRIVQEAVTNVVKHSAATEAAVVIKKRAGLVSVSIRDNGRGFDAAKLTAEPHEVGYGLSGIAERARILGATLAIESRPGAGATLTIEIPRPAEKHDRRTDHPGRG